jgi:lipoprotein-anchoring transpeptidase ErfK/SrfK
VTTPELPNNQLGWMKLDPRRLATGASHYSLAVDLSEYKATLYEGHRAVRSFAVTVGAPGSPTPTGTFAVTDTFRGGLSSAYGCCALALSATQPNLPSGWLGGNRIAIHGTYGSLGLAASHGCVRAANADVSKLIDEVPLGSPVTIRA